MNDLLHHLRWFFTNSRLAFDKRFLALSLLLISVLLYGLVLIVGVFDLPKAPGWVFGLWSVMIIMAIFWALGQLPNEKRLLAKMKYAVHQLDFSTARTLIKQVDSTLLATPSFLYRFDLLKALLHRNLGEPVVAYELYQALQRRALLPQESHHLGCVLASLLFEQGNLKSMRKEVARLRITDKNTHEPFSLLLLESRSLELCDDLNGAKELLEDGLAQADIDTLNKALFLHQFAYLQSKQGNLQDAVYCYNKAWLILKDCDHFRQIDATVENLLILYIRLGNRPKAESLLTEFKHIVDHTNMNQLIALHNLTVNMARELGDRALLITAYNDAEQNLVPKLNDKERLAFEVTGLRMRFNDGVDFQTNLVKVMALLMHCDLVGINKFRAYKLVISILNQALELNGQHYDLVAYHGWILLEWVRNQDYMDEIQSTLPVALFYVKEEWFKLQLETIKLRLNLFSKGIPKAEFERLFSLLNELKRIASDKENDQIQMHALVVIVDEYIAFIDQLDDDSFVKDFKTLALDSLSEMESLMLKHQNQSSFYHYMVALGYFYSRLNIHQDRATQWIELFDSKKIPLNHYAAFFREQYQKAKKYVNLSK